MFHDELKTSNIKLYCDNFQRTHFIIHIQTNKLINNKLNTLYLIEYNMGYLTIIFHIIYNYKSFNIFVAGNFDIRYFKY